MGRKNPIDKVNFYSRYAARESVNGAPVGSGTPHKHDSGERVGGPIRRERVSCFIPPVFEEQSLRLYCRFARDVQAARTAFEKWYVRRGFRGQAQAWLLPFVAVLCLTARPCA